MCKAHLIVLFITFPSFLFGQNTPIKIIETQSEIVVYSIDQLGSMYLGFEDGRITKYSKNGDSLISHSPMKTRAISHIETHHGMKVFVFYEPFQEYAILDRYLSRAPHYSINDYRQSYIGLATYSSDQNLWMYDDTEFSLIKYNLTLREVTISTPSGSIVSAQNNNLIGLKEYHNKIFLIDQSAGIMIFDNLGNYLKTIKVPDSIAISFFADGLFSLSGNSITKLNLYNGSEERIIIESPNKKNIGLLVSSHHYYLIGERSVSIFEK